jgi:ATP-dependent helicase/nuclease subunit A
VNWTAAQVEAIEAEGPEVLCTAAAGSGKTAVLAARVVRRLLAGPGRLLVLTFTRSAAEEMRARIAQAARALGGDPTEPLDRVEATTLHGFCERTLRRHFAVLGLDPGFRILDEAEARALLEDALEEALAARYRGDGLSPEARLAFGDAVERYGGRRLDATVRRLVLELLGFARSLPDPDAWLARALGTIPPWDAARAEARRILEACLRRARAARALAPPAYRPTVAADEAVLEDLLARLAGPWDAWAEAVQAARLGALPRSGLRTEDDRAAAARVRTLRERNREALRALREGPFGRTGAHLEAEAVRVAEEVRPLLELVRDVAARYELAKRRAGALDFEDLEHGCLRVLAGEEGALVAGQVDEVVVDEAQDLSPIQDEILSRLAARGARLFAVGDVRQSIYAFRHAEPRRFRARAERARAAGGRVVALADNFRSRRPVVAAVNFLFRRLFAAPGSGLEDLADAPLVCAAAYPPRPDGGEGAPVGLTLVEAEAEDPEEPQALEREAEVVADRVAAWVGREWVWDGSSYRPARPGDVAVLLRAPGPTGRLYVEALTRRGLPCWSPDAARRAESVEGRTVVAWLRTLDNPRQDIPLAATLLGPLGGWTPEELARVRLAAPEATLFSAVRAAALGRGVGPDLRDRARAFLAQLARWRRLARREGVAAALADALDATGYVGYVRGLPGGAERLAHLTWCLEACREADALPDAGPARAAAYLEGEPGPGVAASAEAAGDRVRVLSIHASKGLEFPWVVVAGLGRRLRAPEAWDLVAHRDLGLGARAVDLDRRLRWPTLAHAAIAARRRAEARAEELRLLYVALTRAREGLCLVGTVAGLAERLGGWAEAAGWDEDPDLGEATCYLDWIVPALARHADVASALGAAAGIPARGAPDPGGSRWEVVCVGTGNGPRPAATAGAPPAAVSPPAEGLPPAEVLRRLEEEAAWRYPWEAVARTRAKRAVGELAHALDPEGAAPWGPEASPAPRRPRWFGPVAEPAPSEVGAAAHALLRHLDLTGPCDAAALAACRDGLVARGLVDPRAAARVDLDAVARLLAGPLGRQLRAHASLLHREVPFALRLPAHRVEPSLAAAADEWVLVQGVADAVLDLPEGLELVDYKTDAAGARHAARHVAQLRLYAEAMARAWGRPVRAAWLAFLATGEVVRVPVPLGADGPPVPGRRDASPDPGDGTVRSEPDGGRGAT